MARDREDWRGGRLYNVTGQQSRVQLSFNVTTLLAYEYILSKMYTVEPYQVDISEQNWGVHSQRGVEG